MESLSGHGSRMNEKSGFDGETLGAPRAQTCARGVPPLDTSRRIDLNGTSGQLPPAALGLVKVRGFWPIESRENPRGKARFPLRDYSLAFPGCKASGLAAFSRRARSKTITSLTGFFKQQREAVYSTRQSHSAGVGSRGFNPLVGCGAKPRQVLFRQILISHSCVSLAAPGLPPLRTKGGYDIISRI